MNIKYCYRLGAVDLFWLHPIFLPNSLSVYRESYSSHWWLYYYDLRHWYFEKYAVQSDFQAQQVKAVGHGIIICQEQSAIHIPLS